ncbi:MAG: hypothetical protein D9V47_01375 [Clostridia bacterium]|nr:MAG: hypothetical protein D9V47_01375 [Clostridia bacterium]
MTPFSLAIQGLYSYRRFVTAVNGRGGVLIVGAGRYGRELARRLRRRPELGLEVIGFLDDRPETAGQTCEGARVLGPCRELDVVLGDRRITEVALALPEEDLDLIEELVDVCRESGVPVSLVGITVRKDDQGSL